MDKNIKILITGIGGFIGSSLESHIRKNYPLWKIYGIDIKGNPDHGIFNINMSYNNEKLKSLLTRLRPRYIFHFAGAVSNSNFEQLLRSNILTTYSLLFAIQHIKGYSPRIIIPSSASEYGNVSRLHLPVGEDYPLKPINMYGFSKMMQTRLSLMFAEYGLDVVIARIFNISGKGIGTNFSIGKFASEIAQIKKKKQKPVLITKSLGARRDFLDIQDICKCLLVVALNGKKGQVYNICRGKSFLIRDLLSKLIDISGLCGIKIVEDKTGSQCEIFDSFGSTAKLRKIFKIFEPISIEESLKNTYFSQF
jgi:GDP-4-dehydro-6-deoxy-D-mannose reductase